MKPRRAIGYARVSSVQQTYGASLDDQQAAMRAYAEWNTLYSNDRSYTRGSIGFEAPGRLDHLAERRATLRASFTLAWSGPLPSGLRHSRGVSRRVERPPEWTGRIEWRGSASGGDMAAKKSVKIETPAEAIQELVMHVIGMADYDIAKHFDPETSEDPRRAKAEMRQLVASVAKRFDVKRKAS